MLLLLFCFHSCPSINLRCWLLVFCRLGLSLLQQLTQNCLLILHRAPYLTRVSVMVRLTVFRLLIYV